MVTEKKETEGKRRYDYRYKNGFGKIGVPQAAELLGLTESTIYKLTSTQRIPHYKLLRKIYFDPEELRAWMESQHVGPAITRQAYA